MAEQLKAVKGMNDILPPDSARWEWLEDAVRRVMRRYGYLNIRTPIVEPTPLFVRGLGEVTDIVEKEMYSFEDRLNGDPLTLRPEGTAGVVRAGLPEDRIVLDPGIGFGKTLEHNLALLAHPEDWLELGRPVLMALSMKSVFGGLLGLPPQQRGLATATATAMLRGKGIFWHRVHDVAAARQAMTVAVALETS